MTYVYPYFTFKAIKMLSNPETEFKKIFLIKNV